MSTHWLHISVSYALVLGGFAVLAVTTALRHAAARRRLADLDPRAARRDQNPRAARRDQESIAAARRAQDPT